MGCGASTVPMPSGESQMERVKHTVNDSLHSLFRLRLMDSEHEEQPATSLVSAGISKYQPKDGERVFQKKGNRKTFTKSPQTFDSIPSIKDSEFSYGFNDHGTQKLDTKQRMEVKKGGLRVRWDEEQSRKEHQNINQALPEKNTLVNTRLELGDLTIEETDEKRGNIIDLDGCWCADSKKCVRRTDVLANRSNSLGTSDFKQASRKESASSFPFQRLKIDVKDSYRVVKNDNAMDDASPLSYIKSSIEGGGGGPLSHPWLFLNPQYHLWIEKSVHVTIQVRTHPSKRVSCYLFKSSKYDGKRTHKKLYMKKKDIGLLFPNNIGDENAFEYGQRSISIYLDEEDQPFILIPSTWERSVGCGDFTLSISNYNNVTMKCMSSTPSNHEYELKSSTLPSVLNDPTSSQMNSPSHNSSEDPASISSVFQVPPLSLPSPIHSRQNIYTKNNLSPHSLTLSAPDVDLCISPSSISSHSNISSTKSSLNVRQNAANNCNPSEFSHSTFYSPIIHQIFSIVSSNTMLLPLETPRDLLPPHRICIPLEIPFSDIKTIEQKLLVLPTSRLLQYKIKITKSTNITIFISCIGEFINFLICKYDPSLSDTPEDKKKVVFLNDDDIIYDGISSEIGSYSWHAMTREIYLDADESKEYVIIPFSLCSYQVSLLNRRFHQVNTPSTASSYASPQEIEHNSSNMWMLYQQNYQKMKYQQLLQDLNVARLEKNQFRMKLFSDEPLKIKELASWNVYESDGDETLMSNYNFTQFIEDNVQYELKNIQTKQFITIEILAPQVQIGLVLTKINTREVGISQNIPTILMKRHEPLEIISPSELQWSFYSAKVEIEKIDNGRYILIPFFMHTYICEQNKKPCGNTTNLEQCEDSTKILNEEHLIDFKVRIMYEQKESIYLERLPLRSQVISSYKKRQSNGSTTSLQKMLELEHPFFSLINPTEIVEKYCKEKGVIFVDADFHYQKEICLFYDKSIMSNHWPKVSKTWKRLFELFNDPVIHYPHQSMISDEGEQAEWMCKQIQISIDSIWNKLDSMPAKNSNTPQLLDQIECLSNRCWILTSLMSLFSHSVIAKNMNVVSPGYYNPNGYYVVKFFIDHREVYTIVDDYLPVDTHFHEIAYLKCSPIYPYEIANWMSLLEKAQAKLHGSYQVMDRSFLKSELKYFQKNNHHNVWRVPNICTLIQDLTNCICRFYSYFDEPYQEDLNPNFSREWMWNFLEDKLYKSSSYVILMDISPSFLLSLLGKDGAKPKQSGLQISDVHHLLYKNATTFQVLHVRKSDNIRYILIKDVLKRVFPMPQGSSLKVSYDMIERGESWIEFEQMMDLADNEKDGFPFLYVTHVQPQPILTLNQSDNCDAIEPSNIFESVFPIPHGSFDFSTEEEDYTSNPQYLLKIVGGEVKIRDIDHEDAKKLEENILQMTDQESTSQYSEASENTQKSCIVSIRFAPKDIRFLSESLAKEIGENYQDLHHCVSIFRYEEAGSSHEPFFSDENCVAFQKSKAFHINPSFHSMNERTAHQIQQSTNSIPDGIENQGSGKTGDNIQEKHIPWIHKMHHPSAGVVLDAELEVGCQYVIVLSVSQKLKSKYPFILSSQIIDNFEGYKIQVEKRIPRIPKKIRFEGTWIHHCNDNMEYFNPWHHLLSKHQQYNVILHKPAVLKFKINALNDENFKQDLQTISVGIIRHHEYYSDKENASSINNGGGDGGDGGDDDDDDDEQSGLDEEDIEEDDLDRRGYPIKFVEEEQVDVECRFDESEGEIAVEKNDPIVVLDDRFHSVLFPTESDSLPTHFQSKESYVFEIQASEEVAFPPDGSIPDLRLSLVNIEQNLADKEEEVHEVTSFRKTFAHIIEEASDFVKKSQHKKSLSISIPNPAYPEVLTIIPFRITTTNNVQPSKFELIITSNLFEEQDQFLEVIECRPIFDNYLDEILYNDYTMDEGQIEQ